MEELSNVIQPQNDQLTEDIPLKGKWNSKFFKNENPIVLELGCGKGEYTVGLAKINKDKNFIGIDIKGSRMWRGAKTCIEDNIENVMFLRTKVDFIEHFFKKEEI